MCRLLLVKLGGAARKGAGRQDDGEATNEDAKKENRTKHERFPLQVGSCWAPRMNAVLTVTKSSKAGSIGAKEALNQE